jgi:hypothetical protein
MIREEVSQVGDSRRGEDGRESRYSRGLAFLGFEGPLGQHNLLAVLNHEDLAAGEILAPDQDAHVGGE